LWRDVGLKRRSDREQLSSGISCRNGVCARLRQTAEEKSGGAKTVIQYDAIPNYVNWGAVTEAYFKTTGVRVPPDMKGSSAVMAALEAEKIRKGTRSITPAPSVIKRQRKDYISPVGKNS
jgi:hypothetical protein